MNIKSYVLILLSLILSACANNPLSSYRTETNLPLEQLKNGNLKQAENSVVVKDNMLYYLEYGTLKRLDNNYTISNGNLTKAQNFIDAWVSSFHNGTLGDAADTATAAVVNDMALPYQAKDYEKVMLPTYKTLNYFALGNLDNARIEITRMYNIENVIQDYRSTQYADTTAKEQSVAQDKRLISFDQFASQNNTKYNFTALNSSEVLALKNSYQNAFSHYLAGFIFQALGENSLSRPGYLKAQQLNPTNTLISQSIKNLDNGIKPDNKSTDLLLVEELGHAPQLRSVGIPVPFMTARNNNSCLNMITIAFPELILNNQQNTLGTLVDNKNQKMELFTNFDLMAARYLHDDLPNIFTHNLLRAAKDVTLQQVACQNLGGLGSLLTSVTTMMLGRADDRAWVMLPEKIYATRLTLPRGTHKITIQTYMGNKSIQINLTKPYQILTWRVIGSQVYFTPESGM